MRRILVIQFKFLIMIIIWLILGLVGYFLIKIFRRPILDDIVKSENIELDLLIVIFMCLGLISLLASANFLLKKQL